MAWQDRITTASYESPSGVITNFDFENVSVNFDKKTSAFTFPGSNGTYVQDLGSTDNRYPLRLFIWGEDYDLVAKAFFQSLKEVGPGILNHPLYGSFAAIPFGRVNRRDDLVTESNQAVFEIMFFAVSNFVGLLSNADSANDLEQSINDYYDQSANEFDEELLLTSEIEREEFKNRFQQTLSQVETDLNSIAETQADVFTTFQTVAQSINASIDILIADPITLANQTLILIQTPSRALFSINSRLIGYKSLIDKIVSDTPTSSNDFYSDKFYANGFIVSMVNSTLNNTFDTKPQAIEAIESILEAFDSVSEWVDRNLLALNIVDTGAAYQRIQETTALAAGFLVELSFSLKQENIITLDRPRTIIDLAAELYQDVSNGTIDFLINSNALSGSEILEIKRGRKIVYYV